MTKTRQEQRDEAWDYLIETGIATEDELILVTNINGFNLETLNNVIHSRTGYHDLEQLIECEG